MALYWYKLNLKSNKKLKTIFIFRRGYQAQWICLLRDWFQLSPETSGLTFATGLGFEI